MSWEPLLCANGGHRFPAGESVLMHNAAAEDEPARFVCHPCWCFGLEGHAETRRTDADPR